VPSNMSHPFHLTDLGNARRYVSEWGTELLIMGRKWHVWDGTRYRPDDAHAVDRLAQVTVDSMWADARQGMSSDERKAVRDHAARSESEPRLRSVVSLAATQEQVIVSDPATLDADPLLFNCLNGTVDLRTGVLRPPERSDRLTKRTEVTYTPDAPCEAWEAFLARIQPDPDVRGFLQRVIGYTLTGFTSEEVMMFLHGSGANGKSTLIDTIMAVLGEYAVTTDPDLLIAKRERGGPAPDVLALRGARLASTVETGEGARLDEIRVKELVTGDAQTARGLYQDPVTFRPKAKFWVATNHKPVIRNADEAIWRRILLIPFDAYIPPAERNRALAAQLRDELPGILGWAVRGCLAWQRDGLAEPAVVRAATAGYRTEQDLIGGFIADECVQDPRAYVPLAAMYLAYRTWCENTGENPQPQRRFNQRLGERGGITKSDRNHDRPVTWCGIGLRGGGAWNHLRDTTPQPAKDATPAHIPTSEPVSQPPAQPAASSQPRRGLHLYGVIGKDGLTIVTDRRAGPTEPLGTVDADTVAAMAHRLNLEAVWIHVSWPESHKYGNGWTTVPMGSTDAIEVCVPHVLIGGSTWAAPRSGRELAQALAAFEAAVGFRFRTTPATTGLSMLGMLHHRKGANPLVDPGPLPDVLDDERALRWSRPLTDAERGHRYVHGLDKHGAYLAAAADLAVGVGKPGHIEGGRFDPRVPGVWKISGVWRHGDYTRHPDLPSALCGDPRSTGWRSTPTLVYASEQGVNFEVEEAWVWPKASKPLTTFYTRFRDGRTWLMADKSEPGRIALAVLKEVYAATLGGALAANRTGARAVPGALYRPDWRSFIVARARVNLLRNMDKHGVFPFAVNVDEMLFTSDSPDPASVGLPLGDGLGEYGVNHYLEPTEPQWDQIFRAAHAGRTNDLLTAIK